VGIDLGSVAREVAQKLGSQGGGHPQAAGATLPLSVHPETALAKVLEILQSKA
jgi:nanoRNase/pAp phosphatase (c-di-AMP/oligoRNAs hydrolase)